MDTVTIQPCTVADIESAPNIDALMAEYAQESAVDRLGESAPQWDLYRQLQSAGVLRVFAAYSNQILIGFMTLIITKRPHYKALIASYESFFVTESARKTGAGGMLLKAAEEDARLSGAAGLIVNAAIGSRLDTILSLKDSYSNTHKVFLKVFA